MNFLAHLYLAEPNPESRMGNLLGDFVKGRPWDDRFNPDVWKGIMEHRHIDVFTDSHPVWQKSRKLIGPGLRRYAGIIIDIFYDHFLTRHWNEFSPDISVDAFIEDTYVDLRRGKKHAPEDAYEVIDLMMEENWLGNYGTIGGIRETIEGVSQRSPNLSAMKDSTELLVNNFEEMEGHFLEFFPSIIEYVNARRAEGKDEAP